jgi:hypothetical protein
MIGIDLIADLLDYTLCPSDYNPPVRPGLF